MTRNNNRCYTFSFKFTCLVSLPLLCYIVSASTLANSVTINHSQLEQYISLQDEDVLLSPAGEGLFLSFDIDDNWSVQFDYQTWQDKEQAISPVSLDLTLTSLGTHISYMQDNWYIATSIGFDEDDVSYRANKSHTDKRQDNTQVTSISAVVGSNWLIDNWMFDLSMGLQYADWSIENIMINNQRAQQDGRPPEEISKSKSDSSTVYAGLSSARYWPLTQDQGIIVGAMLSWNYQFSGDANLSTENSPAPRRTAGTQSTTSRNVSNTTSRVTSGDDNYGQIMAYLSYDITHNWSVDLDTAAEISTTYNNVSWSVGVNYAF